MRAAAENLGGHPALLGLLVGNEIPPDIVRWYGPEKMRDFLRTLTGDIKDAAPGTLVSYANFPSTEYLDVSEFVDFVSFNVYLHREDALRRYLSRLQNIAEDKPLVLTEFGADSIREGEEHQAELLSMMVRTGFESGAAGCFVFSWTDDWFTGGSQIADWAFGVVDAKRGRKPAFHAVQAAYTAPLPPPLENPPLVSVVVCAYNADRTMDACLESLRTMSYPNYEVVVVNDGSTDRTLEISQEHERRYAADPDAPRFILIDQPNKGLSVARNVGAEAGNGEIIAYTDSDCVPDPDWLSFLVYRFVRSGFVAVGGPNFPPPEPSLVPAAVAVSPGGPTHVLLDDEVAEHIPGCNMAFTKEALHELNGFEPIFAAAGDDVDFCWRLQNRGHPVGFSAAATVWHYRRNTVNAYLKQQMGYGKAEALLYFKHPYRFNLLGQSRWLGDLRRADDGGAVAPARDLLRGVRPRPLPVALRGAVVAAQLPAVHARVERHRHPPLRGRPGLAARAADRDHPARDLDRLVDRDGDVGARRSSVLGVPRAGADRGPHLPRPAGAWPAALPLAPARLRGDRAGAGQRATAAAERRHARARLHAALLERAGTREGSAPGRRDGVPHSRAST